MSRPCDLTCLFCWLFVFPGLLIAGIGAIAYGSDHYTRSDCLEYNSQLRLATRAVTRYVINEVTTKKEHYFAVNVYGYYRLPYTDRNISCIFQGDNEFCHRSSRDEADFCFFQTYTLNVEIDALIKGDRCSHAEYESCWPQSRLDTELWVIWISFMTTGLGLLLMGLVWGCVLFQEFVDPCRPRPKIQWGPPEIIIHPLSNTTALETTVS